jgi:hypothetical protein
MNGVSYEWKSDANQGKGRDIGLIAQEVETVLPELVVTDNKGYKSLSYDRVVPVLVEAIKEQQKTIDSQNASIKMLTERLARLESRDMTAQK